MGKRGHRKSVKKSFTSLSCPPFEWQCFFFLTLKKCKFYRTPFFSSFFCTSFSVHLFLHSFFFSVHRFYFFNFVPFAKHRKNKKIGLSSQRVAPRRSEYHIREWLRVAYIPFFISQRKIELLGVALKFHPT